MAQTPGIAVIGCGTIARYQHLPHLHRLRTARLVAAADPDAEARQQVARRYAIPVVAEAADLIALPGVDALVIASPTPCHAEHALLATAAGKPFYLEKPLATTADEARRLLAALSTTAGAALLAVVGFNYRLNPVFQEARRLVCAGALGDLLAVQTLFCEPLGEPHLAGWRSRRSTGGGAGLDLASHHVDLLRWLLDTEIVEVTAASAADGRIEQQTLATTLRLAGGVDAQCLALFGAGPRDRIELVGSRSTLLLDRHRGTIVRSAARARRYGARTASAGSLGALGGLRLRRLVQPSWEPSFARAMAAFVDALRGDGNGAHVSDLARVADGAASLAVVLAAERAAKVSAPVGVERLEPAAAAGEPAGA